jgi:hypothetical protein
MRYHSLIVDESSLPGELRVVARTADGIPMALEHATWPAFGVQFHPESILTEAGHLLLANFLRVAGIDVPRVPPGDAPTDARRSPDPDDVWWTTPPLHLSAATTEEPGIAK